MQMKELFQTIKRHGTSLAFVAGFIWDNIMLSRIDHWFANVMLTTYLILSALCILAMNLNPSFGWKKNLMEKTSKLFPFILQFCFGSLCSAYIILYTRSASLISDWPFLVFLVFLVISNELLRHRYLSITLPGSIFFAALFSYNIFSLPILTHSIGDNIFILSGIASLTIFLFFVFLLSRVAPERFKASKVSLFASIVVIYILFNLAYFGGFIPPVPIALKEIGVYHTVVKTSTDNYELSFEPSRWYKLFGGTSPIFHKKAGESVYVWSAIFAPTALTLPIFHRWQYFNEIDKGWVTTDLLQFSIVGGRDQGYRGYSVKTNVFPAKWRIDVETTRGDLVGRIEFSIDDSSKPLDNLITIER